MSPDLGDEQFLTRLRALMRDPAQRQILQQELDRSAGSNLPGALTRLGTAMQSARTPGAAAATGLGGAIGIGLGTLLRRRRAIAANQNLPSGGVADPTGGGAVLSPQIEPNLAQPAGTGAAPLTQSAASLTPLAPVDITPSSLAGAASQLLMGTDRGGMNVHSTDGGQTWVNDAGARVTGPIYNQTDIGGIGTPAYNSAGQLMRQGGRVRGFARGGHAAEELPPSPPPRAARAVLTRRPMHIPIIATTIIIAKKKPTAKRPVAKKVVAKRRAGGALKPHAIPPKRGPGNGNIATPVPPAPCAKGGHVQVPRGSGIAQRGKRFRGIF